eukprot:scaffold19007_cov19-Tisochrysis_lutea.AAC.2
MQQLPSPALLSSESCCFAAEAAAPVSLLKDAFICLPLRHRGLSHGKRVLTLDARGEQEVCAFHAPTDNDSHVRTLARVRPSAHARTDTYTHTCE